MEKLGSLARTLACAASLCAALVLLGCGGGTGGGGPFTKVIFENNPLSPHAITQADFAYFPISGLPDRVARRAEPGEWRRRAVRQMDLFQFIVPLTFLAMASALIAVTLVACYVPARRAARLEPVRPGRGAATPFRSSPTTFAASPSSRGASASG